VEGCLSYSTGERVGSHYCRTAAYKLEDDIAATRLAVAVQRGPTVLVGHSYGGAVITEAGVAPKVKALVYVAALQPDKGESLAEISSRFPMDMKMLDDKRFVPNPASYHDMIGADLPRDVTDFMAASAKPMRVDTFQIRFQHAAWHDKPSFGIGGCISAQPRR
jgi:pimeloyl-ACP methyl ester carboxylesterase